MLTPFKFTPILKERIWGGEELKSLGKKVPTGKLIGESWEISDIEGDVSVVSEGKLTGNTLSELIEVYMEELVGESVFNKFGQEFPLLIKFIDAQDNLSVQVHPDDKLSSKRHHSYGKTEMWYVLDCKPGAELYLGFNRKVTRDEYQSRVDDGTLMEIMKSYKVKPGDAFYIPAGEIHAIGIGIVIAEIQQTSDITYRVFDFNRVDDNGDARELHTELALDAINFNEPYAGVDITPSFEKNKSIKMQSCKYFSTNVIELAGDIACDYSKLDSFVIYIALEGDMVVKYSEGEMNLTKGESILVPASINNITLSGKGKIIEVFI